jgi:hypothetical protein
MKFSTRYMVQIMTQIALLWAINVRMLTIAGCVVSPLDALQAM